MVNFENRPAEVAGNPNANCHIRVNEMGNDAKGETTFQADAVGASDYIRTRMDSKGSRHLIKWFCLLCQDLVYTA